MLAYYYQTKVSQIKNEAEFSNYYNNLLRNTSTAYSCLDLSTRCKVCLKEEYATIRARENSTVIIEALKVFGNLLSVSEDNHLCSICYKFILQAIAFRQIAMRSDQIVQNQIDNEVEVKVELVDDDDGVRDNTKTLWTVQEMSRDCSVATEHEWQCKLYKNHQKLMNKVKKLQRVKKLLECPICKKILPRGHLGQHLRLHNPDVKIKKDTGKVMVVCQFCKKVMLRTSMQQHMLLHGPDVRKHVCEVCGKTYTARNRLWDHQLTHKNEFTFKCRQCPYRGQYVDRLKSHMLMHTQPRKHLCTQCPARFNHITNLKRHNMWIHEKRKFECDACDRAFHTQTLLQEHNVIEHLGHRHCVCNICGNTFGNRRGLMTHQRNIHKRPLISKGRPSYLIAEKIKSKTDETRIN